MWILLYQFLGALIYIEIHDLEAVWIEITVKIKNDINRRIESHSIQQYRLL